MPASTGRRRPARQRGRRVGLCSLVVAVVALTGAPWPAAAGAATTTAVTGASTPAPISADPFTGNGAQHATEVEPDTFAWGRTVVATFQVGRFASNAGSTDNGWATSTDGGSTWRSGWLGLPGSGSWTGATDPSVAYDARHDTWLISSVMTVVNGSGFAEGGLLVSRSTNGGLGWSAPVTVTTPDEPDKGWITCDNTTSSRGFGTCYELWSAGGLKDRLYASTSTDAGQTWSPRVATANSAKGYAVQPVVQPDGTVVVVEATSTDVLAYRSLDGGASWTAPAIISGIQRHTVAGGLRVHVKPTVGIAGDGTVWAAWMDCRFRTGCPSNDIVLTSSADGTHWSAPSRVPIDPTTSTVDHFLPGLGVDPGTSGTTTSLGLSYYWLPTASCGGTGPVCKVNVSYTGSTDAGATWSAPRALNPTPMSPGWLPSATGGRMVGDYFDVSFVQGNAVPVVSVAQSPSGTSFRQGMWAAVIGPNLAYAGDVKVLEGDSSTNYANVPISLGSPQSTNTTITYTAVAGTAVAGTDYAGTSGSVEIPAGSTTVTVPVAVYGDMMPAGNRTFGLQLTSADTVALAGPTGTVTIVDEEGAPRLRVGNAAVLEGDSGSTTLSFPVTLDAATSRPVSVKATVSGKTATAGSDFTAPVAARVTIPAGATGVTVPVDVIGDTNAEANETLRLTLSAPVGAVLADGTGSGTIVDDDNIGSPVWPLPSLSISDATGREGDGGTVTQVFTVTLSASSTSNITVYAKTTAGTATAGIDYTAVASTKLVFAAGSTSQTFPVPVLGDTTPEPDETYGVTLSSPTGAALADASGVGTIVDDDFS